MENSSDAESDPPYEYSDDYDELYRKETAAKVGSIAVPLFFSIVVILRSLTNIFILNLAVSDLMFTLGLPFWSSYIMWGWILGDGVCKGVNFVFSAGYYSSIMFLVLMTIQRYVAVVFPLSEWEGGQQFAVSPILAWVVSISAAVPAVVLSEVMPDPEDPNKLYYLHLPSD
ncbi:hypothetical protein MHYP_G00084760 [Metynnis hypsauchen]